MRLYLAALYTSNFHQRSQAYMRAAPAEKAARDGVKYLLESYHYIHKEQYVERIRSDSAKVFLDSGAFSAFTKNAEIDIPTYVEYVKKNWDIIEKVDNIGLFSVLDKIGDKEGGLGTYRNQMYMEHLGVKPLPCFHYGEDERYLEWYIQNYSYITIGGMVPITTPQLFLWLDRIWDRYLTDGAGRPKLRVHGFGLTSIDLMERYPWFSVDSSSWVQIAANGAIYIRKWGTIFISKGSPTIKEPGRHLDNIPEAQRRAICAEIERLGFSVERLQTDYIARWAFCCGSFTELNEFTNRQDKRFKASQPLLF
jgi:hypothetical protein